MEQLIAYQCLECGHYTITKYDGRRCAKCGGHIVPKGNATNADTNKYMTVNVSLKDSDKFQELLSIINEFIEEERVPI